MPPDRWNDKALDGLEKRLEAQERVTGQMADRVEGLYQVLIAEKPNGEKEPAPTRTTLDLKTAVSVLSLIVVPIIVAIIYTSSQGAGP